MRQARAVHVGITFNNTVFLRSQLQEEIVKLERQLQSLRLADTGAHFAMVESYKQMIYSRRGMLTTLPH